MYVFRYGVTSFDMLVSDQGMILSWETRTKTSYVVLCRLCPKLEQYEREFLETDMWQKHYNEQTKPLLNEVQRALGLEYNLSEPPLIISLLLSVL